jgi:hypothetical protein
LLQNRSVGSTSDKTRVFPGYGIIYTASGNNDHLSTSWREVISLAHDARSLSDPHGPINLRIRHYDGAPPARGVERYRLAQREKRR